MKSTYYYTKFKLYRNKLVNDSEINDPNSVADAFNDFFLLILEII